MAQLVKPLMAQPPLSLLLLWVLISPLLALETLSLGTYQLLQLLTVDYFPPLIGQPLTTKSLTPILL